MPTIAELREAARLSMLAGEEESDPHLKRRLARHAFALAQLAEKIEREKPIRANLAFRLG